jgi:hypothetical protein
VTKATPTTCNIFFHPFAARPPWKIGVKSVLIRNGFTKGSGRDQRAFRIGSVFKNSETHGFVGGKYLHFIFFVVFVVIGARKSCQ